LKDEYYYSDLKNFLSESLREVAEEMGKSVRVEKDDKFWETEFHQG